MYSPSTGATPYDSLPAFLQREYCLDKNDIWEFSHDNKVHKGKLVVRGSEVLFAHPDAVDPLASPNKLYHVIRGKVMNMPGTAYRKLMITFRRSGKTRCWQDLKDEWSAARSSQARRELFLEPVEIRKTKPELKPKPKIQPKTVPRPRVEVKTSVKRKNRTEEERRQIFHSILGRCYLCRDELVYENRKSGLDGAWHIEHVIPFCERPDLDDLANMLPAHAHCNQAKSRKSILEAVQRLNFTIVTKVLHMEHLHPDVRRELEEAKRFCRARKGIVVVTESVDDHHGGDDDDEYGDEESRFRCHTYGQELKGVRITDRKLGTGGQAVVYVGCWSSTEVAVKKPLPAKDSIVAREMDLLWPLKHANIAEMHGYWVHPQDQVACMVMERMEGDLLKRLRKLQPVKFMLDIAQGMKYLHSHNIIHRDLAPQNILIDESKTAKIADFGLAKHENDPDDPNTSWVTHIGYKAPEASRRGTVYGLPVDVYSYGKLFMHVYSLDDYRRSSRVDKDLMELAEDCVERLPQKRPTFAAIVVTLQALVLEDA